jgi:hypothetical protein
MQGSSNTTLTAFTRSSEPQSYYSAFGPRGVRARARPRDGAGKARDAIF